MTVSHVPKNTNNLFEFEPCGLSVLCSDQGDGLIGSFDYKKEVDFSKIYKVPQAIIPEKDVITIEGLGKKRKRFQVKKQNMIADDYQLVSDMAMAVDKVIFEQLAKAAHKVWPQIVGDGQTLLINETFNTNVFSEPVFDFYEELKTPKCDVREWRFLETKEALGVFNIQIPPVDVTQFELEEDWIGLHFNKENLKVRFHSCVYEDVYADEEITGEDEERTVTIPCRQAKLTLKFSCHFNGRCVPTIKKIASEKLGEE